MAFAAMAEPPALSLQIATPDEARATLQLKGGRDVAF